MLLSMVCNLCGTAFNNAVTVKVNENSAFRKQINNINPSVDAAFYAICPKCKKESYFYSVDNGIANVVSLLNNRKYKTTYSCQGHCNIDMNAIKKKKHITNEELFELVIRYASDPYVAIRLKRPDDNFSKNIVDKFRKAGWTDISIKEKDTPQYFVRKRFNTMIPSNYVDFISNELDNVSEISFHVSYNQFSNWLESTIDKMDEDLSVNDKIDIIQYMVDDYFENSINKLEKRLLMK